jgi:hypothetical protein
LTWLTIKFAALCSVLKLTTFDFSFNWIYVVRKASSYHNKNWIRPLLTVENQKDQRLQSYFAKSVVVVDTGEMALLHKSIRHKTHLRVKFHTLRSLARIQNWRCIRFTLQNPNGLFPT